MQLTLEEYKLKYLGSLTYGFSSASTTAKTNPSFSSFSSAYLTWRWQEQLSQASDSVEHGALHQFGPRRHSCSGGPKLRVPGRWSIASALALEKEDALVGWDFGSPRGGVLFHFGYQGMQMLQWVKASGPAPFSLFIYKCCNVKFNSFNGFL